MTQGGEEGKYCLAANIKTKSALEAKNPLKSTAQAGKVLEQTARGEGAGTQCYRQWRIRSLTGDGFMREDRGEKYRRSVPLMHEKKYLIGVIDSLQERIAVIVQRTGSALRDRGQKGLERVDVVPSCGLGGKEAGTVVAGKCGWYAVRKTYQTFQSTLWSKKSAVGEGKAARPGKGRKTTGGERVGSMRKVMREVAAKSQDRVSAYKKRYGIL